MYIIGNSLKQMMRTPVKAILFWLLIALTTALLTIGTNLRVVSEQNLQIFKSTFKTRGTVRQKPNILKETARWDAGRETYEYFNTPVFDSVIPVAALDFDGANYIHSPKQRPYYGAYHESFVIDSYEYSIISKSVTILEAEPLADCVPSGPVRLSIKRILFGDLSEYTKEIWFCDHFNDNPYPMYAGKPYILSVQLLPITTHSDFESLLDSEYIPSIAINSSQYNKDGARFHDVVGEENGWEEVTEGYYDTPRGQRWFELINGYRKLAKTIPVMPVDATHLLMGFFEGNSNIIDGRDISDDEYGSGSNVCLIQQGFAKLNNLVVGDTLPLPLYYANYRSAVSRNFPLDGGVSFDFGLLNEQGKSYSVFENSNYTIVGIYTVSGAAYMASGFEAGRHMVIIPSASVKQSDERNIIAWAPMQAYNTSLEIQNGMIGEFIMKWNRMGISNLEIQFYDKGFSQLKDGLDRMRVVSTILSAIGSAAMVFVLIFFTFLFIVKNKKRTAVERSLGLRRRTCTLSLISGMVPLSVLGIAMGSVAGYLLNGLVVKLADTGNQEAFDLLYSNWINSANEVTQVQINSYPTDSSMLIAVTCIALIVSVLIISIGVWINLRREPLTLLCTREGEN
jgi:hypothetical protein